MSFFLQYAKHFIPLSSYLHALWREVPCDSYLSSAVGKVSLLLPPGFKIFIWYFIFCSLNMICLNVDFLFLSCLVILELPPSVINFGKFLIIIASNIVPLFSWYSHVHFVIVLHFLDIVSSFSLYFFVFSKHFGNVY